MKNVIVNIGRSVSWFALTSFFGLLQLWILLFSNAILKKPIISYNQLLTDGFILFFIIAIVSTITIDFLLSKLNFSKFIVAFLFILYPMIIVIISSIVFCIFFQKSKCEIDFNSLETIELTLLTMAIIYTLITKTLSFLKD